MNATDADTDLEHLMRRWHHTTEFATAAWADYQALRDELPLSEARVAAAHARWRAAEIESRSLMAAIEAAERAELAPYEQGEQSALVAAT